MSLGTLEKQPLVANTPGEVRKAALTVCALTGDAVVAKELLEILGIDVLESYEKFDPRRVMTLARRFGAQGMTVDQAAQALEWSTPNAFYLWMWKRRIGYPGVLERLVMNGKVAGRVDSRGDGAARALESAGGSHG